MGKLLYVALFIVELAVTAINLRWLDKYFRLLQYDISLYKFSLALYGFGLLLLAISIVRRAKGAGFNCLTIFLMIINAIFYATIFIGRAASLWVESGSKSVGQ